MYRMLDLRFLVGSIGHVVDSNDPEALLPEKEGIEGELLIEGAAVARGYLNDKARSSAAFLTAPRCFDSVTASRMKRGVSVSTKPRLYLTGDLVQRCEDGSLRIIGRKDRQVKIRGQKVDLNEIKHHFLSGMTTAHDLVSSYANNSTTNSQRRHELVAYGVARDRPCRSETTVISTMTKNLRADLTSACANLRNMLPSFIIRYC
jgi:acyl-CoA synthetase (AMP-forming)/AMP-acid ligase II